MSRIRTIKPELFQDELLGNLSRDVRLLFVGLITIADDEGHFRAHPASIRSDLFRYDDVTIAQIQGWLDELAESGRIILYDVTGQTYGAMATWKRHQKIDKPNGAKFPAPPSDRFEFNTLTKSWLPRKHPVGQTTTTQDQKHEEPIRRTLDESSANAPRIVGERSTSIRGGIRSDPKGSDPIRGEREGSLDPTGAAAAPPDAERDGKKKRRTVDGRTVINLGRRPREGSR